MRASSKEPTKVAGVGFAVAAYLTSIAWGVTHLTGLAARKSITGFFHGDLGVQAWAVVLIASAALGLTAVAVQRRQAHVSEWSWVEFLAAGSMGMLLAIYWWALVAALGWTAVVTTQIGFVGVSLGALLRVIELAWPRAQRLIFRAHPAAADSRPPGDLTVGG